MERRNIIHLSCPLVIMQRLALFLILVGLVGGISSCSSNNTTNVVKGDALYRILVGEKSGFMDENGKVVIEPQFDDAYICFSEGVCYARIGDRRGLIDRSGVFSVELADSVLFVANFVHGLSRIDCGKERIGIINTSGKYIIPANNYDAKVLVDGESVYLLAEGVHDDNDWYVTDQDGRIIGEPCDSIVYGFSNGLCPVKKNEKWGYMDPKGNIVIDYAYDEARSFKDGIARVKMNGRFLFIDKTGRPLIPADSILTGFSCNRAAVVLNGEQCLVDRTGRIVSKLKVDRIYAFNERDRLATAIINGHASKIDTSGTIVLSTGYDNMGPFTGGLALVSKDGKLGYIDSEGNEVIKVAYEEYFPVLATEDSKLRAVQNQDDGVWTRSYYDLQGNLVWKDTPSKKVKIPRKPERKGFVEYFDAKLSELEPIEGIYYVTDKDYYQDRDNLSLIGLNESESQFYAVVKDDYHGGFVAYCLDGTYQIWVNKFVKIGESDTYAIMGIDNKSDYSSEGRITIEDYSQFDFKLDRGHNNWYNFFVTYEFVRDYPPLSEMEKIKQTEWTGSGFAIADGYVATNYHVTSGAKTIRVKGVNGNMKETYNGYVVASDKDHDLSIIRIVDKKFDSFGSIPYSIGKASVEVGDDIFVLGYPMTSTMGDEIKLTNGIISSSSGYRGDESMYQISAAVQPGNSGGPLFNSDGTVVGIVCGKHADAENANYAIKVSYLYSLASSSDAGIEMNSNNHLGKKSLSKKVKAIKNYVFLIECSSK